MPINISSNNISSKGVTQSSSSKKDEPKKEAAVSSNGSTKVLASLAALGALGGAIYLIAKKGKSSVSVEKKAEGAADSVDKSMNDILKQAQEQFDNKFKSKYGDELTPHMEEIEKMIGHEDAKTRINSIISFYFQRPPQSLKEKMILGLMKKSEKALGHNEQKHCFLNHLLPGVLSQDEFSTEFLDKVIFKLPELDEKASLSAIGSFLGDNDVSKKLSVEHLDKISAFLDDAKTKELDLKQSGALENIKSLQDLSLACKITSFSKADLTEQSISKVREVLDNKDIIPDDKLSFINRVLTVKLEDIHNPLAQSFKDELLTRVLDMDNVQYNNKHFSIDYQRKENTFYLARNLYSSIGASEYTICHPQKGIEVTGKMQKFFERTQDAGLLKDTDDVIDKVEGELQKSCYDRVTRDNIEARNHFFFEGKGKGTIPADKLAAHVDEMIEHFVKAKNTWQTDGQDWLLRSDFEDFEYTVNSHFNMKDRAADPKIKAAQDDISKKLHECGEKHFGCSYSKYYEKTDSSQEEFNFKAFCSDKVKASKDFLVKTVEDVQDDSLQELIKKMQAGKLSADEFTDLKKKLSIKFHPDKVKGSEQEKEKASMKMQLINAHLDTLKASLSQ